MMSPLPSVHHPTPFVDTTSLPPLRLVQTHGMKSPARRPPSADKSYLVYPSPVPTVPAPIPISLQTPPAQSTSTCATSGEESYAYAIPHNPHQKDVYLCFSSVKTIIFYDSVGFRKFGAQAYQDRHAARIYRRRRRVVSECPALVLARIQHLCQLKRCGELSCNHGSLPADKCYPLPSPSLPHILLEDQLV
jgi:hypothetical protein